MTDTMLSRYQQAQDLIQCRMQQAPTRVTNDVVLPIWIKDSSCFWYIRHLPQGREYRLVNADAGTNNAAFDHSQLADLLAQANYSDVDERNLPIANVTLSLDPLQVRFTAFGQCWLFESEAARCEPIAGFFQESFSAFDDDPTFAPLHPNIKWPLLLTSPNGNKAVFARQYNLWCRDQRTGEEKALTMDGQENNAYGSGEIDVAVPALWDGKSRYVLTLQYDTRAVENCKILHYVPTDGSVLPQLAKHNRHYATSGQENTEIQRLLAIDTVTGEILTPDTSPLIPYSLEGRAPGFFRAKLAWWSTDNQEVFFVDIARGQKTVRLRKWDLQTGKTQVVMEESSDTYVKLSAEPVFIPPIIVPLPQTNELIWFSERSGWGHLYLYDLSTGQLKNSITQGDWLVRDLLHYDAERRELLLQTAGRNPEINPYYRDICKVNIDTGALTPLASGNHDHNVCQYLRSWTLDMGIYSFVGFGLRPDEVQHGVSPCGRYIVSTCSRVDTAPETILLDRDGDQILTVETADVSGLPANWCWPKPEKLKSADAKTDIYAVVFRPPGYSEDQSYPVVEYTSSGRGFLAQPQGAFNNNIFAGMIYANCIALATLGFVVVVIEGRGTPLRHKAFSDYRYGEFYYSGDFEDRISGIRQLAKRYSGMDLQRVGIVSTEVGTNAIYAPLKHSDFYKVAVMHCFADPRCSVARFYEVVDGMWKNKAGGYPEEDVASFSGKLLIIQGMLSPFAATMFRVVDALQQANKDFDMLCLPNMAHAMLPYTIRREWDYLVRHLMDAEPPAQFELTTSVGKLTRDPDLLGAAVEEANKHTMKNWKT